MRASPGDERRRLAGAAERAFPPPAAALAALLLALAPWPAPAAPPGTAPAAAPAAGAPPARASTSVLDPAFRLPAGGKALAGPALEARSAPPSAWLLSEDRAVYVLTEEGSLAARIPLPGEPARFLALDPFGRALVLLDRGYLAAFTRLGVEAWRCDLGPGTEASLSVAFGADGRLFAVAGSSLVCVNPHGRRLWTYELGGRASAPAGTDGLGRPLAGLEDGSLVVLSPYGEPLARLAAGSPIRCAAALAPFGPVAGGRAGAGPGSGGGAGPGRAVAAIGTDSGRLLLLGEGLSLAGEASPSPGSGIASLAGDGDRVLGLSAEGRAFCVDRSGKLVWSTETGCRDGRLALFAERVVVEGRGKVVSLSKAGEIFREMTIANASGTALVSPAGLAFSSGADWVLAAYRFERPLGHPLGVEAPPYPKADGVVEEFLAYEVHALESGPRRARLADIENALGSGTIGAEEGRAAAFASAVALGELERGYSDSERRFRGDPMSRARACAALGELGSPEYREPLTRVLATDADPAVRSAACEALAEICVDPGGISAAAFLAAASRPVDERTAMVLIAAIERMTLRSGSPPALEAVRAVLRLAARPYGANVRDRAAAALGRLAGSLRP